MATLYCLSSNYYHYKSFHASFLEFRFKRNRYVIKREKASYDIQHSHAERDEKNRLRILIAGGGIVGLVLALAAKHRGCDVKVFEKDLSAVRGEGRRRGPIQLMSNALAVLQAIDRDVAKQIIEAGCVAADRDNGFAGGVSGKWFSKFDLSTPAIKRGVPPTILICRMVLQDILLNAVGLDKVSNKSKVVDFIQDSNKVAVILEDGQHYDGDVLVGADGIWSTVRSKLFGQSDAKYSDYTCYTGLYRVYLGLNQYFGTADVGNGKMQWYAFHKELPNNTDPPRGKKKRLLNLFGHWCKEVIELISETPEDTILRRDIYDRDMIYNWGIGRATLLGDAAHAMQPNLGQGGCMAIEDCYQLILELDKFAKGGLDFQQSNEIATALRRYEKKRMFRVSMVHAAARIASKALTLYQPYMKFGSGPFSVLVRGTK